MSATRPHVTPCPSDAAQALCIAAADAARQRAEDLSSRSASSTLASVHRARGWTPDAGMYEPLYLSFDAYPSVVPRVRVRGVMALFLAAAILWALVW